MKSPLEKLEARFKDLFEGRSSIQDWMKDRPDSIRVLLKEIDRYLQVRAAGEETVTGQFVYYLCPEDMQSLGDESELEIMVSKVMIALGTEYGITFAQAPRVKFIIRKSLLPGQVEIKSILTNDQADQTGSFAVQAAEKETVAQASLLLSDDTMFLLPGPVTNLGRKSNNHIVFDDLRVSRNHAQIRHIYEEYVLFDTGSSGGTFVNGERINQSKLKTGDVISLAGVKLIFSQEENASGLSEREITSKLGTQHKDK
jgi:hypothetical protein